MCTTATFFVRDLVTIMRAERAGDGLAGCVHAQPIGVWVRLHPQWEAGTCPLRLNQGVWYICAHMIGDPQRLAVLLAAQDVAMLERELSYLK